MVVKDILEWIVNQLIGGAFFLVLMLGTVAALIFGTNGLIALGLPRNIAGSITTILVITAILYGLYYFATEMIDW